MKIRTILMIALAVACCTDAQAQTRKKKKPQAPKIEDTIKAVPADSFSYAMGVAQSSSLMQYLTSREGIDSTYIKFAIQAINDYATLDEEQAKQVIAYAAGLRIGEMNKMQIIPSLNQQATGKADTTYTDLKLFSKGLCDGLSNKNTINEEMALQIAERQMAYYKQQLRKTNSAWLDANKKQKGVKTTESGLQYRVLVEGKGVMASDTSEVEVHYEGRLIDGTVFDSSYKRKQPATFRPTQVIKGWTEALQLMPEGSVWELYIPYNLAYGERGNQSIPPYATLIFKVEMLKVKSGAVEKK